jgi:glucose/arabinose dehydrogenase
MDVGGRYRDHGRMTHPRFALRFRQSVRAAIGLLALVALTWPASVLATPTAADKAAGAGNVALGAPGDADIALSLRERGLTSPVFITSAHDGTNRLFIVEQPGRIKVLKPDGTIRSTPFLDIRGSTSDGFEQGLLGLAFHPSFETNRRLYVYFTNSNWDIIVREYRTSATNTNVVDMSTKRKILEINHPGEDNHNGGMLAFGPDGYLYIGTGDGGGGGDPDNSAQNKESLLGKMLRIDVNGRTGSKPYGIPSSNPYVGMPGRNEIWQIGLRNPWRWSFDRANGNLWIADVGQEVSEEVDRATNTASGPGRGINWGWRVLEGFNCYNPPTGCNTSGKTMPLLEYGHGGGRCSVTGGYVYRGTAIPALVGGYVFADFCSGEIWVTDASASSPAAKSLLLDTGLSIASFGETLSGELYVVNRGGSVYQIVQG